MGGHIDPAVEGGAGLQNAGFEVSTRLIARNDFISLLYIRRRYLTSLWSFEMFLKLRLKILSRKKRQILPLTLYRTAYFKMIFKLFCHSDLSSSFRD